MPTYRVRIEEITVYEATIEADSEREAMDQASELLEDSDGPESAFGHAEYGDTFVASAHEMAVR